MQRNKKL
jgi:hypothetical protein